MAKRFTDTDKWQDPWFNNLEVKAKLAWIYLCDMCDHAGIWRGDFKLLSFHIGTKVTEANFQNWFEGRVIKFQDKFFIRSFFDFQYANAKDGFRAKSSAVERLQKLGLLNQNKEYVECPPTLPGDSIEAPSISIGISIGKSNKGGVGEKLKELWDIYPRKLGKKKGFEKLQKIVSNDEDFLKIKTAVQNYSDYCQKKKLTDEYIKHFNRFVDVWEDYLEPVQELNTNPNRVDIGAILGDSA